LTSGKNVPLAKLNEHSLPNIATASKEDTQ
jgi:hypothetical protein